ncbi:MAG: DUF983 domain-containing protein [Actinomycetota bacterium]
MAVRPTPPTRLLLWRGLTRACAVCGRRRLTRRWVALPDACPRCGFEFERKPGHFVGAVGMSTIITFGLILLSVVGGVLIMWPDPEAVPLLAFTLPIAVLFPILFHATARTLWVGIDLMMKPLESGEAVGGPEERAAQQG